jgi:hypothetical protein
VCRTFALSCVAALCLNAPPDGREPSPPQQTTRAAALALRVHPPQPHRKEIALPRRDARPLPPLPDLVPLVKPVEEAARAAQEKQQGEKAPLFIRTLRRPKQEYYLPYFRGPGE